jgi:LDH2 family malate/lactate/ureidoglycolate dehydrogenase
MPEYARYSGVDLRSFLVGAFEHYGVPRQDAVVTAEALVHADEMGIDSHGVARVAIHPAYAPGLRDGQVDPTAVPELVREAASTGVLDGRNGLGPVAATRATELAIDKARQTGAGFISITNSRHYGAAAHYAMLALDHGMIGVSMTIGGLGVVPTYGRGRRLGINPLSVAAPAAREHPFVLDIATSVVAGGKLELARMSGQRVPLGWIVDREGRPTTDPTRFWDGGALLPLGGAPETGSYKGYGLSVMIDIFCGVLSGAGFSAILRSGGGNATPHFVGAFNISGFRPLDEFTAMMDDMIRTLRETEPAEGAERVLVHGQKEFEALTDRRAHGIPLHPEIVGHLRRLAEETGVPLPVAVG